MPLRIRVAVAVIFLAGALLSVFLIAAALLTIEIADGNRTSWTHTNSVASHCASFIACMIEITLTTATDERSRVGTIACSCLLVALCGYLLLHHTVGSWFIFVLAMCMSWNLLLLRQATHGHFHQHR